MFHYFKWKIQIFWKSKFLTNDLFWLQVNYLWNRKSWEFFLYPYLDDNKKSVFYYCFENIEQKLMFEDVLKLNWIWPKTAFQIVQLPQANLQKAIKSLDVKYFQSIPWIGPKSAKKILLELKWNFDLDDFNKIDIDQDLFKSIVSSLKWFGYEVEKIKRTLQKYPWKISKENISTVIKRVISKM